MQNCKINPMLNFRSADVLPYRSVWTNTRPDVVRLSEMIVELQKEGFRVERYQMTSHPQAFLSQPEVMRLVREKQMAALPIIVVRGGIVAEGRYPKLIEIQNNLNGGN